METLELEKSICSDGICCFACVIGEKAAGSTSPLKLVIESRIHNEKNPRLPVITNHQVFESCPDLGMSGVIQPDSGALKLNLRCTDYQKRPKPCRDYPIGVKIPGPCLYNEYLAPQEYKMDIHKFDWGVYYGVLNNSQILTEVFGEEIVRMIPDLLKTKTIKKKKIGKLFRRKEYLLFPVPTDPKVLLTTKEHPLIASLDHAMKVWPRALRRRKMGKVNK